MGNAALQVQIATGATTSWASAEGYAATVDEAGSATGRIVTAGGWVT